MPEQKVLDAFFALLHAGLWGTTPDPAFFVSFTGTQWRALLALAQKQAVLGLIYAGVSRLPKALMPDQELLLRLYGFAEQIRKNNARIGAVAQEVCGWFEEAGLEPIVLKGFSVGAFYAEPDLRQPGDLDLFFHRDYEQVVGIVQVRGISVELDANHDKFWYRGVLIELHSRPFRPLLPIPDLDLSPIWQDTAVGKYRVLNIKANALLLLIHPAVHFLEAGLGFRQLCDWAVFVRRSSGRPELEEAWNLLQQQDLGIFCREFTALAVEVLHLEMGKDQKWIVESRSKYRKLMLQEMLRMGNFGAWSIPKLWEIGKWFVYIQQKMNYALRVYPFCPEWFWKRLPQRFVKMVHREYRRLFHIQ